MPKELPKNTCVYCGKKYDPIVYHELICQDCAREHCRGCGKGAEKPLENPLCGMCLLGKEHKMDPYEKLADKYADRFVEKGGLWGFESVSMAIREALEADNPYKVALGKLAKKLVEVDRATEWIYAFVESHGMAYDGPNYGEELGEAKKLLGI